MNYLDAVNGVLRRLREPVVTSVYQNRLSSLVAELLNDAKDEVENAHDWSHLRGDVLIATTAGTTTYSLVGAGNRITVKDVRDLTNSAVLREIPSSYIRRQEMISNVGQTRPSYYALQGEDSSGDTRVKFWPVPDGIYSISFHLVTRTEDLQAEGDEITVPHEPVVLLARAMAAAERGDVGAEELRDLYGRANSSLSRHIQLDAAKNPEEMIWRPE